MIKETVENNGDSVNIKFGAWLKEGQYGKFFSLKVSTYKKPEQKAVPEDDSDIPF